MLLFAGRADPVSSRRRGHAPAAAQLAHPQAVAAGQRDGDAAEQQHGPATECWTARHCGEHGGRAQAAALTPSYCTTEFIFPKENFLSSNHRSVLID